MIKNSLSSDKLANPAPKESKLYLKLPKWFKDPKTPLKVLDTIPIPPFSTLKQTLLST